jgi:Domain of unknown function (DUF4911)
MKLDDDRIRPIFLKLPTENIVLLKFTVESYDGLGIVRTINPEAGEVVILAIDDTEADVRKVLAGLMEELKIQETSMPEFLGDDWLLQSSE